MEPFRRFIKATRLTWGDLTDLVLVLALLLTVAAGVVASGWAGGLGRLVLVTVVATLTGMLLAKSIFTEVTALLLSTIYGWTFIVIVTSASLGPGLSWHERYQALTQRLTGWVALVAQGEKSQDGLVLAVFVAALFWYLGHNAAWHTFRLPRLGRTVLPPAAVLVVNNLDYQGPLRLDTFLIVYGMWVLLLAVRSHLAAREYVWRRALMPVVAGNTGGSPGFNNSKASVSLFRAGLSLALVLVIVVAALPTIDPEALIRLRQALLEEPLEQLQNAIDEVMDPIKNSRPAGSPGYFDREELPLGGPITMGEGDVMYVRFKEDYLDPQLINSHRFYWRARVYERYDGLHWYAEQHTDQSIPPSEYLEVPQFWEQRQVIMSFTWAASAPASLAYVAQQAVQIGLPVEANVIINQDGQRVGALDMRLEYNLNRGSYYEVLSLISKVSPARLRGADTVYPHWVTERYLRLPRTVTPRTHQLALTIANQAGAVTPYDQAIAIETWLRENIVYDEKAPAPPAGREDFVDWVLFDLKAGYCSYYASSMVVMLRSLGIPARMAGGFAEGTWDDMGQRYTVRENDTHAWVEVFFPNYGWVEFEPTANRSIPPRDLPPPAPTPTFTPTFTPTSPESGGGSVSGAEVLPTLTPTPTPTLPPTNTPPPLASGTVPPSDNPLVRAIALLVFLIMALVVMLPLVVVAIWWWVEMRGLGGLSATGRAYARLYIYGRWLGIRPASSKTPAERSRELMGAAPRASRQIVQITGWYNFERYRGTRPARSETVDSTWAQTRWALIRQVWQRRWERWLRRFGLKRN